MSRLCGTVVALIVGVMVTLIAGATAATAAAHPLGDFSVNSHDGLVVMSRGLLVDHVQDLAEIPTAQVRPRIDAEGMPAWATGRCEAAAAAMRVTVDGRRVTAVSRAATARMRPGQAGLPTLHVECRIEAMAGPRESVVFRDDSVEGTVGWHEVTAQGDGMTLTASDVPAASRSRRLTAYPADPLSTPVDQRGADLRVRPGGVTKGAGGGAAGRAGGGADEGGASIGASPLGADRLTGAYTDLVAGHRLTPGFAVLALLLALALGALHALAPGHGKTLMAAYAAGHGGRARRDVLTLGLTVTLTHTAGVLVLGLMVASGSALAPASVYPWLGIASGALVAGAGLALLRRAVRAVRHRDRSHTHGHVHGRTHGHGHVHGHPHGLGHRHGHTHGHRHTHVLAPADTDTHTGTGTGTDTKTRTRPRMRTDADTDTDMDTDPGASADAQRPARPGGAALMGFAGGLVPSPSAVLVLVGATALGQAWFGVALVLSYGAGLAATLVLIGLLVVGSGRALARRLTAYKGHRHRSLLPVGTAALVVLLGVGLALRNLPTAIG